MKIMHLMLWNFYIDDGLYQENILPYQNLKDGHDVKIVASTLNMVGGHNIVFEKPSTYSNEYGIEVTRMPYVMFLNNRLSEKIRKYKGLYDILYVFEPDIIFCHGIGGVECNSIIRYLNYNPSVKLYIDCHSDMINSARNWFSKNLLHGVFYRKFFLKLALRAIKVFYITPESRDFIETVYKFRSAEKLEYFPLGGYPVDSSVRQVKRDNLRTNHNISDNCFVILHSGKFNKEKKSLDLIQAFTDLRYNNMRLFLLGSFPDEVYTEVREYINNDARIHFLGWKTSAELNDYLCACDVFVQPGSRTVTVQNAACSGAVIVVNHEPCYTQLFGECVLYANGVSEIKNALNMLLSNRQLFEDYKTRINNFALDVLDYRILATKYY